MTEQPENIPPSQNETQEPPPSEPPQRVGPPTLPVPRNVIYAAIALVIGSFFITTFVHNPYLDAAGGDLSRERSAFDGYGLWAAIFIGIPAAYFAWVNWLAPLFKRR